MDGIIIVNKEKNYTSRDVVNIVGKALKTKKVGHAGTLDPLATGVLIIGVNKATKLLNYLSLDEKEYIAEVIIGIKTDTYDVTGKILNKKDEDIKVEELTKMLKSYQKKYSQEVPIYSATKVNGRKLYEYARNNEDVILPEKEVEIYSIKLINKQEKSFSFYAKVSKGTYIRSLINDISNDLNINLTMSNLQRISQGSYNLDDANSINDIKNNKIKLLEIEDVLNCYKVELDDMNLKSIQNGNKIDNIYNKKNVLFYYNNRKIAIYHSDDENNKELKPLIMF